MTSPLKLSTDTSKSDPIRSGPCDDLRAVNSLESGNYLRNTQRRSARLRSAVTKAKISDPRFGTFRGEHRLKIDW